MAALQRRTRKARLNNYKDNGNKVFLLEDYIEDLKSEIEQALEESRPSAVKKEIIILNYAHGVDLPNDKINRTSEVTRRYGRDEKGYLKPPTVSNRSIRQCVAGITGTIMSQSGLFKDKLAQDLYKYGIHKINLQARKKVIENTIRLHTAEDTYAYLVKMHSTHGHGRRRYLKYLQTVKIRGNIYDDRRFEKSMNFDVRTIKPQYNHAYDLVEPLHDPTTVDGKNDDRFGIFTVLHSTEPEDQENTVFGCCGSEGGIDISKISPDKVDLHKSKYWERKLKHIGFETLERNLINQRAFAKHGFHRRVIFLSTLTNYLSYLYDNIYLIDVSCRDLSRYFDKNPTAAINRNQIERNEVSKGSYSPAQLNSNEDPEEESQAAAAQVAE
jgi:hypothetical protein